MTSIEVVGLLKALVYIAPLILLLRHTKWRWLVGALIALIASNMTTALGAGQLTSYLVSWVFTVLLLLHVFDVSKYDKPVPPQ